jgi:transcriptional regulator
VTALTRRHEANRPLPWAIEDAPGAYIEGMLKAIVGFSLPIEQLQGKRKLSQNRSSADQQGVARGLAASQRPTERELATLMDGNSQPLPTSAEHTSP